MQRAQILKAGAVCAGRREKCSATSSASSGSSPKTNSSGTLQVCRGRQRTVSEAPSTPGSEGIRFGVQGSLRRFWNSRSQSGKPIATDASVDGKCTSITTDEVKVPSSVSVSSPIHVCDDVVTTKGDCGLVCTGTQTSVEFCRHLSLQQCGVAVEHGVDSSLHSEGLLPKLRYGSRRMVKRLMRRLRLPSTWEATLIHSLNEARGNPHTVAAALTKQLDSSCGKLVLLPPITAVGGENLECCRTQYNTQRTDEVPRVQGGEGVSDEITHSPVRRMDGAPPLTVGEVSGAQPNKQRAFPLQTTNASAEDSNLSACVSGNTPEGPARPSFGGLDLDTGVGAVGRKGSIVGTPSGSSENQPGDANKTSTLRTKGASTAASGGLPLRAPRVGEDFQLQEVCKVNAPFADGSLRTDSIFQLPGLSCRETPSCEQSLPKAGLELSLSTDNKEASRMEGVGGAYFSGGKGGACPSEKFWTSSRSVDEANPVDPFATDGTLNRAVLQKTAFATPLTPPLISAAATEEGCVPPPPTLSVGTTEDKGIPSLPPPPPPPPPPVRGKVPENRRCCKTRSVPIDKTQYIAGSSAFCASEPVNLPGDFFQILAEEFKLAESSSTRKAPGLVAETIVSTDREKNVGVVLRVLRLPVSTIEECVRSFDDDTLSEECVASLAKVIPTKEERRLVESWINQDPAVEACKLHRLSTVSQFFVMCVSVDLYAERIECWNMRNEFNCRVEDLEQKLKRAHDGIRAALDTKRLPRVLQYILAIGNFLNAGSRYEDAKGFSISQLDQIIQFPTTDRKRTLLEHAVMVIERCEPDLHRFTQELLPKVEYAGGFDTVGVTSEIQYLRERLEKCVTLVHTIAEDNPWTSKLDPFLRSALPAMERIEQHHSDLEAVSEELAIFFCEDPKTFPMNKVMRCLSSFAKSFPLSVECALGRVEVVNMIPVVSKCCPAIMLLSGWVACGKYRLRAQERRQVVLGLPLCFINQQLMRVRTKREGVSNNFGSAYVNCEIISAFIKQKREENSSSGLCPSAHTAVEWSIRAGSRTAFLLHEVPISCGPSSPVGKECGAPENNDNSVENGDTGTYKLVIGDEVVSAIMSADDELDRSDALRLLSQKLCEVFRIPVGITTGDNSHGNCLWSEEGSCSVLTPQELRELPSRWIMQSLNEATVASSHRNGVTLLDCGATVCLKSEVLNDEPKRELSSEPVRKRNYKPGNAPQYRVCDVADMANGQYWVEVEPLITGPESTGSVARRRFDRDELLLSPPQPVYFDPLLPVDEINNSRGTSACLFLSAVLAVGRIRSERAAIGDLSMWDMYPKNVTLQMGYASRDIRRKVHELCAARRDALHVEGGTEGTDVKKEELELRLVTDYVTLRYKGKTIEVLQRTVERLSLLWDARLAVRRVRGARRAHELWLDAVETQAASDFSEKIHVFSTVEPFFMRLFTLLLRYSSLFGDLGYNQGPHAAVPPAIMQQLCQVFDIQCEAFASPLNAQLPLFCSLFPDTDYFFGSLGSFFDIALTAGHFEVNPPFVTAVLQRLEKLLLKDTLPINDSDGAASMLFVVVLPSHDLDETERSDGLEGGAPVAGNTTLRQNNNCDRKRGRFENDGRDKGGGNAVSTDRALRESPYCLAHVLCSAHESVYVDGHQHMLRAPLFCIGSPTRLIVLGNRTARLRYSDAATRLQSVREAWRGYTLENRVDSP